MTTEDGRGGPLDLQYEQFSVSALSGNKCLVSSTPTGQTAYVRQGERFFLNFPLVSFYNVQQ